MGLLKRFRVANGAQASQFATGESVRSADLGGKRASLPASIKPTGKMPVGPTAKMVVPRPAPVFNTARWVLKIYSCLDEGAVQGGLIGKAANDVVVFQVAPADLRPDAMRQLNFDAALHLIAPVRT